MNVLGAIANTMRPPQPPGVDAEAGGGGGQQQANSPPWMISTAARGVGTFAGIINILFGFFSLLNILNLPCLVAGVMMIVFGFILMLTEAPCCCVFFEFAYMPATIMDKRPAWVKALLYLFFAAVPFLWCTGVTTFFACGLTMATSAIYLLIAMGKKADRNEMRVKTGAPNGPSGTTQQLPPQPISSAPRAVLVQNEELPVPSNGFGGGSGGGKVMY